MTDRFQSAFSDLKSESTGINKIHHQPMKQKDIKSMLPTYKTRIKSSSIISKQTIAAFKQLMQQNIQNGYTSCIPPPPLTHPSSIPLLKAKRRITNSRPPDHCPSSSLNYSLLPHYPATLLSRVLANLPFPCNTLQCRTQ